MRIRGLDEETEQAMEDFDILQGKIADLTKTADKPGGISLFRDKEKTEYKSTYEVLKDISEIYHDLTDKNQAALLEALAGKRGGQVLAGILDDFSEVERAMGEIEDSAGSADDEMKIVSESITFKLNALKQTWVDFLTDVLNRKTTGQFIDNLTKISEKLIALLEEHPGVALMEVATAFKIIGSVLKGNLISKSVTSLTQLINTLTGIKTGGVLGAFAAKTGVFGATIAPIKEAADKYREVADAAKQAGQATQTAGQMASYSTVNGFRVATTGMTQMAAAEQGAAAGGAALTGSMSALLPVLATVAGVIAAVAIGAYAWDRVTTTVKEAEEELNSVSGKIETITSQIKELEDLDYRTAAQEKKLQFLRAELELEEKIYAVKQRQVIQEQFGNKFSDYTDKDNYRAKFRQENRGEEGTASYLLTINKTQQEDIKDYYSEIAFYNKQIEGLQNQINAGTLAEGTGAAQIEAINKKILETKDKIAEKELEQNSTQADITAKAIEYTEAIEDMESKLEMMESNRDLYTAKDIASVKEVIKLYRDQLDTLRQAQGTYAAETGAEYASAIESAFEHVEFEGVKDKLVQMGKDGSLSVEYLANNFEELLSVMGLTTDQADILYAYLMRLADPLRSERNNFALQWQPTSTGTVGAYQQQQYEKVMEYINQLTDEEFQILMDADIDWSTFDYEAFKAKASELLSPVEVDVEVNPKQFNNQDFSENLTTKLADLQKSYESFITDVQNGKQKAMDLDSLESMRKDLVKTDKQLGVTAEQFKAFEDVVGNSTSTAQEMQDAYDTLGTQLANVYFDKAAEETGNLDDKTKQLIKDQLILKGFTEESVDKYVEYKSAINGVAKAFVEESEARKQMSEADKAEEEAQAKRLNQMIQKELATAPTNAAFSPERLEGYKEQVNELKTYLNDELHEAYRLGVDLDQTIYGNIDTNTRQILRWTDENIEKYKDAILSSIKDIDEWTPEQINEFLDNEYRGAYSTVDADMADFHTVTGQSIPIAFTPMLQTTEDGTGQPIYLDSNTLDSYLQAVVTQAGTDLSAENILRIDSEGIEGFEAEGIKIKNLIAGIGNEAEKANVSMHFTGVHGSINETKSSLEGLNSSLEAYEKQMSEAGHSNEEMAETAERIKELREEIEQIESDQAFADFAVNADANLQHFAEQLGVTSDSLIQYTAQMMIANGTDINNQESVAELQRLMASSGLTTEVITKLIRVMEIYQTIASGVLGTNTQAVAMAKQEVQTILDEIAHMEAEGMTLQEGMDFDPTKPKNKNTGGGGGGSKEKTISEQFEEELKKLKEQYDRGEIDLATYLNAYKALIEKYFSDTEKYAEERAKALHDYMQELKGYYDSAISGVTTLIDHRIKAVQKQKDAALKAIEDERKAAKAALEERKKEIEKEIKARQSQIKEIEKAKEAVQAEIDKINQANKERENAINLQKSLYELERAQQQRTKLIVIYVNLHSNVMIIKVAISVKFLMGQDKTEVIKMRMIS